MTWDYGVLLLHAGADEIYAFEDVDEETATELLDAWWAAEIRPERLSVRAVDAFRQLLAAGVLRSGRHPVESLEVALVPVGDRSEALHGEVLRQLAAVGMSVVDRGDERLTVYLRTNGQLRELYAPEFALPERPHILVDCAYAHTVSLGPLVFPSHAACLGCLSGRIDHSWGDTLPPSQPAMLEHPALIAALISFELEAIAAGDCTLVNASVAWDLRARTSRRDSIYKLPWCPFCRDAARPADGRVALPWARSP